MRYDGHKMKPYDSTGRARNNGKPKMIKPLPLELVSIPPISAQSAEIYQHSICHNFGGFSATCLCLPSTAPAQMFSM